MYAIVDRRPARARLVGVAGEPIALVRTAGLWVATGRVEAAPPLDEPSMRAHDRAVRALADRVDAILPARFGATVTDVRALARHLAGRTEALERALERVTGCVQMSLRLFDDAPGPASAPAEDLAPGRRYLEERREDARVRALREHLRPLVRDERSSPGRPPLVASLFHLVARDAVGAYEALLAHWEADLRVRASGPWPPYGFAPELA